MGAARPGPGTDSRPEVSMDREKRCGGLRRRAGALSGPLELAGVVAVAAWVLPALAVLLSTPLVFAGQFSHVVVGSGCTRPESLTRQRSEGGPDETFSRGAPDIPPRRGRRPRARGFGRPPVHAAGAAPHRAGQEPAGEGPPPGGDARDPD